MTGDKPAVSAAMVDAMGFYPCPAVDGASVSSCSAHSDGAFAGIGEHNEDVVCPLCELCDDDLRDGPDGTSVGTREVVTTVSVKAAKEGSTLLVFECCNLCDAAA
jgi:hypothetical protein